MSPGPARARPGARRRAVLAALVAVTALVAATVLAGPPGTSGAPLDPRSTEPDGLRGVLDLADAMGQDVDIATELPSDTAMHLLVVRDQLGPDGRDRIGRWVEAGGHLVVADPGSPLHDLDAGAAPVTDLVGPSGRQPDCDLGVLADVGTVHHGGWTPYEVPDDGVGCFAGDDGAWLVARSVGDGTVVALGSPAPLLNQSLDRADNAVLAAALLFPSDGDALRVLPPDRQAQAAAAGQTTPDAGSDPVADLLPQALPGALVLAALAVVLLVLALGRRLGRPVEERLPATVPSAELARSVGELLQRAGSRQGAAARLRSGARAEVARALGLAAGDPGLMVAQARTRLRLPTEVAELALLDHPVGDDEQLVAVARATATVHDQLASTAPSLQHRAASADPLSGAAS